MNIIGDNRTKQYLADTYGDGTTIPDGVYPVPHYTGTGLSYIKFEIKDMVPSGLGMFVDKEMTQPWEPFVKALRSNKPEVDSIVTWDEMTGGSTHIVLSTSGDGKQFIMTPWPTSEPRQHKIEVAGRFYKDMTFYNTYQEKKVLIDSMVEYNARQVDEKKKEIIQLNHTSELMLQTLETIKNK